MAYFMQHHEWGRVLSGKSVCVECGLMRLHNALTDWCVKMGCEHAEHPQYRSMLRILPARHRGEDA